MLSPVFLSLSELVGLQSQVKAKKISSSYRRGVGVGNHKMIFRGRGMDFSEARNYQAGDEIRHMEWRVTARTGKPHVKVYEEERERPLILLVDYSPTMFFGTRGAFKSHTATRLAALFTWHAQATGDRVGGVLAKAEHLRCFQTQARAQDLMPWFAALANFSMPDAFFAQEQSPSLIEALKKARALLKQGSVFVLISDGYALDEQSQILLGNIAAEHSVYCYQIGDAIEWQALPSGQYPIADVNAHGLLDMDTEAGMHEYQQFLQMFRGRMEQLCSKWNVPYIPVSSQDNLTELLQKTFPWRRHGR